MQNYSTSLQPSFPNATKHNQPIQLGEAVIFGIQKGIATCMDTKSKGGITVKPAQPDYPGIRQSPHDTTQWVAMT